MNRDPEQTFVVWTVTRKDIAESLNEAIERTGVKMKEFEPDDERLTDEECQVFAEAINDVFCEVDELVDKEAEYYDEYVTAEAD
jgi:hypothetical protein